MPLTKLEAYRISRLHYEQFVTEVSRYARDREALLDFKTCIEAELLMTQGNKPVHNWYVKKGILIDGHLRNVRSQKIPSSQTPGDQSALIITLSVPVEDEQGIREITEQVATMLNLSECMARIWRNLENPLAAPCVKFVWKSQDLTAIPLHIWDDTKPEHIGVDNIPEAAEPHHELFSR